MHGERIRAALQAAGYKPHQVKSLTKSVRQAAYRQLVSDWHEAEALPPEVRELLRREAPVSALELARETTSSDGQTVKLALRTRDGQLIETVLMIHPDRRRTVCVSSQVGCPMGCAFCATGKLGFTRNLSAEEIVDQVLHCARRLHAIHPGDVITNVVVMGMGEPLHNYDAVLDAFHELNNNDALAMSGRRFAISTCGIVPGILRLADENVRANLAVSLHAPNQALRETIMPVAKSYALDKLMAACRVYVEKTGRKILFEYLLIDGVNDGDEQAEELARLMDHPLYQVNLIKYHDTGAFRASPPERRTRFQRILWDEHRVPVTTRVSFGEDITAACGQLAGRGE